MRKRTSIIVMGIFGIAGFLLQAAAMILCLYGLFWCFKLACVLKNIGLTFYMISSIIAFLLLQEYVKGRSGFMKRIVWAVPFICVIILLFLNSTFRFAYWNSFWEWEKPVIPYLDFVSENLQFNLWRYALCIFFLYLILSLSSVFSDAYTLAKCMLAGTYDDDDEVYIEDEEVKHIRTEVRDSPGQIVIEKETCSAWINKDRELQVNGTFVIHEFTDIPELNEVHARFLKCQNARFVVKCILMDDEGRIIYSGSSRPYDYRNQFDTFSIVDDSISKSENIRRITKAVIFIAHE